MLAEDHLVVEFDVENSAAAFDQLGIDAVFLLDCVRQTDGCGLVVSLHAVFDGHSHELVSFLWFGYYTLTPLFRTVRHPDFISERAFCGPLGPIPAGFLQ